MVCETEQAILDAASAQYDAVIALEVANDLEYQQIQYQKLAAIGQVMMAYELVQNCLSNSGGGPAAMSPEQTASRLTKTPSASEIESFVRDVIPGLKRIEHK